MKNTQRTRSGQAKTTPQCKRDVAPNPLALTIRDQLQPIVDALLEASPHLEPQRCCGIETDRTKDGRGWRPSSDQECHVMTIDLIYYQLAVDTRKPVPPQVAKWLRDVSAELLATAITIEGIPDEQNQLPILKPTHSRRTPVAR